MTPGGSIKLREAIAKRHSYRGGYTPDPVSRASLEAIVQAGIDAPSGKNRQTTSLIIIDDEAVLRRVLGCVGNGPHMRTAQAAVVVLMDTDKRGDPGYYFGFHDFSAAVENMLLAITDLGLAIVWIEGELFAGAAGEIAGILEVPEQHEVRVLLPPGYPVKEGRPREKMALAERAWFNRFGGNAD